MSPAVLLFLLKQGSIVRVWRRGSSLPFALTLRIFFSRFFSLCKEYGYLNILLQRSKVASGILFFPSRKTAGGRWFEVTPFPCNTSNCDPRWLHSEIFLTPPHTKERVPKDKTIPILFVYTLAQNSFSQEKEPRGFNRRFNTVRYQTKNPTISVRYRTKNPTISGAVHFCAIIWHSPREETEEF